MRPPTALCSCDATADIAVFVRSDRRQPSCCTMDAANITNYFIGDVRMTWFDAEAYCQLQGTKLASAHSTHDRENAKALCEPGNGAAKDLPHQSA